MISIIVAVAQNGVIGAEGRLLWHIAEDLRRFKSITMGHPVIMGRKTFESLGKPLPGRENVVITRNPDAFGRGVVALYGPEGETGCGGRSASRDQKAASTLADSSSAPASQSAALADRFPNPPESTDRPPRPAQPGACRVVGSLREAVELFPAAAEAFVIGGGEIYAQALPFADKVYLTVVEHDYTGDTHFPPVLDPAEWRVVAEQRFERGETFPYSFRYVDYERK